MSNRRDSIISNLEKVLVELKAGGKYAEESFYPVDMAKTIIKEYRKQKKINREEFSKIAGISPGCLKAVEDGSVRVGLDNLQKILNVLGKKIYIK